jgi:hypothetical protein
MFLKIIDKTEILTISSNFPSYRDRVPEEGNYVEGIRKVGDMKLYVRKHIYTDQIDLGETLSRSSSCLAASQYKHSSIRFADC